MARMAEVDAANDDVSIGEYLIQRLQDYGIGDVFGIPGDYVLSFYTMLEQSPLETVGCTREDCAGFAADAYARVHGMGALCVTYCVGGLSVCNSIAGAYAEKSPVVMITGSPGLRERDPQSAAAPHGAQLPHAVRRVRKAVLRGHRADRSAHGVQRDRPRAGDVCPLQAAGVHRDSARHGPRAAAGGAARTSSPETVQRYAGAGRGGRRNGAADREGPAAGASCWASKSIASACRRRR